MISGDHPETVAALAHQVGFKTDAGAISGEALTGMDAAQLAQAAEEYNIFGRVAPQQKAQLVQALRERGHNVAMIGDGVSDVLALKRANLGILIGLAALAWAVVLRFTWRARLFERYLQLDWRET